MTLQTSAPENFRSCRWGDERTVKRAQTGSEDPHRRERKLDIDKCISHIYDIWDEPFLKNSARADGGPRSPSAHA